MTSDLSNLIHQARSGDIRAASRLMSRIVDEPQRLAELLSETDDRPQPRLILGITGAPGSGKSTLTDRIASEYRRRYPERRLGIIAVDPSSPFTGGAILGDRVRMMRHSTDPNVFIRSLASRGHLGGLALGARAVVHVMGLIGCEVILVETVGVGQSEVEVASRCDLTLVVLAPGQGDSIQMLKAGLIEAGDLFVINKSDREGADQLYQSLVSVLQLKSNCEPERQIHCSDTVADLPNVFLVSASSGKNVDRLVDAIDQLSRDYQEQWKAERREQIRDEVRQAVLEEVRQRVLKVIDVNGQNEAWMDQILRGKTRVTELAGELMRMATLNTETGDV